MNGKPSSMKIFSIFFIFIFNGLLTIGCGGFFENRKLNQIQTEFFEQYCEFFPAEATLIGVHKYDDKLGNYGPESIPKMDSFFQEFSGKLADIDSLKLSETNKLNYQILNSKLNEKKFEFQRWKRWQNQATFYGDILQNIVQGMEFHLIDSSYSHVLNMANRFQEMPNLLFQARENLKDLNLADLSFALDQLTHVEDYFTFRFIDKIAVSSSRKDSLEHNLAPVLDSLQSFRKFLESQKTETAIDSVPLEGEEYKDLLNIQFGGQFQLDSLVKILQNEIDIQSKTMYLSAISCLSDKKRIRRIPNEKKIIELMDEEVEKEALKKNEIMPFSVSAIEDLKRFIDEIWNVSLPLDYNVRLIWSNSEMSHPMTLAHFETSGFFDATPHLYCILKPVEGDQDWIRQLANLRKYNKPTMTATMMLEANLSHFKFWSDHREQIPMLAQAFPNQTFLRTWPYFLAFKLLESGYGGYDEKLQFVVLKKYIKTLHNALKEIQYYKGDITKSQFEQHLLKTGLFNREEAIFAFRNGLVHPGQALHVFWGMRQFNQLENIYRDHLKRNFNFNEFIEKTLLKGPVSIKIIKNLAIETFASNNK